MHVRCQANRSHFRIKLEIHMCNCRQNKGRANIQDASKWCSKAVDEAVRIVENLPEDYYDDHGDEE
jgi:hypothetical protein